MAQICRSALVDFSAAQLYQLVNHIEDYPNFLPGCNKSRILERGDTYIIASINVKKAGISKTFTTRNTLVENQSIHMQLVEGPFRQLNGDWRFIALGANQCKVEFHLEFEFTNKLVELVFGRIFQELIASMVQAFSQRAKEVYGD